ncbi:carboxypeptidase-like regulatory domain-containing protein [Pleionea sp. CnH1-48]|uniref:carboxypeptidase-like regulatory domain-containing protein n=1 Tax=Pleionea sp. CnH1-48 TaxID=2954494 RepID=UPI0020973EDE|nr:carboxypeptidase-like regulatory domain-containing protein [Pleionea sp. CnH1-48]MCO7225488.1 carboxypeptidase-like regulatory domain-containing protein [Pleionea sp. CnH1-48]
MDILKNILRLSLLTVASMTTALALDVRPGLQLEVVYCENSDGSNGCAEITHLSGSVGDLELDPLTGNLFIAQAFDVSIIAEGGNIIAIDPSNGTVVDLQMRKRVGSEFIDVPYIPFFSRGMDFSPDGTLYFGVSNLMLASWRRTSATDTGVFRTLSSIPLIIDVEATSNDDIYVGVDARGGPQSIYRDAILKVDPGDGFFEPVLQLDEILALNLPIDPPSIMSRIAVDASGALTAGFSKGDIFRKAADGTISLIHKRDQSAGGVNNVGLEIVGDMVFELDSASGHLYAVMSDGSLVLVASGPELSSTSNTDSALVYDGTSLFFINANRTLYKLSATSGTLAEALNASLGTIDISGETRFRVNTTTTAVIPEATVTLGSGQTTTSDANGLFSFTGIQAGLIEIIVTKENFNPGYYTALVTASGTVPVATEAVVSQLPAYVAPGIDIEVLANKVDDGIDGSSDITMDVNGDLYVMNNSSATISKIDLDPTTRVKLGSRVVVDGVGGGSSWFVAVDQNLNIYSSFANDGVFQVQEIPGDIVHLTQSTSDPSVVTDQNGTNRMISTARDVDGGSVLSNGTLIMSSGSGGTDTFNSLVSYNNGVEAIYSRGIPDGATSPVFANNDLVKTGSNDTVYVTNANGNLVQVSSSGTVELVWPGDGSGKPEGIGGFSNFSEDLNGNLYVRGTFIGAPTTVEASGSLRMISADRSQLITAVAGIRSFSGVAWEADGKTAFIANKDFIYRIRSINDRLIAEELTSSNYVPPSTSLSVEPFDATRPTEYDPSYYDKLIVQTDLLTASNPTEPPAVTPSGGSGSMPLWMFAVVALAWMRRYRTA